MKYAVGIDVGGTNTRVALINEKYEIKERVQFGSDPKNPLSKVEQQELSIQILIRQKILLKKQELIH